MAESTGNGKYKCAKCGYFYDPGKGGPKGGIAAGTRLEDLPGGRKRPRRRQPKETFNKA